MKKSHHSYAPGILLIAGGIWLMSRQSWLMYDIWRYLLPVLLGLLAGAVIISGKHSDKPSSLFWGSFLGLMSVFYFLANYDLVALPADIEWPVVVLAAGLSFLIAFFIRPKRIGMLFPAFLFTVWGGIDVLESFNVDTFDYIVFLEKYWPGLLILLGIILILRSLIPDLHQPE